MEERVLGRTERPVSVIGLGTWQLGGDWGEVERRRRPGGAGRRGRGRGHLLRHRRRLRRRSQRAADRPLPGRQPGPGWSPWPPRWVVGSSRSPENYTLDNFRAWTRPVTPQPRGRPARPGPAALPADRGLLPRRGLRRPGHPGRRRGRSPHYGVSVETCDEALTAISRRGTATVQIILNAFRTQAAGRTCCRPPTAAGVGIIARVPLASGLLSGRYTRETTFAPETTAAYNRHGEAFDVGETFSGVDFETGVAAAAEFAGAGRGPSR